MKCFNYEITLHVQKKVCDLEKQNDSEKNKKIINCWEKKWKNISGYTEEIDPFFSLFKETYEIVQNKEDKNRINNFKWKKRFIWILAIVPGSMLIVNILPRWFAEIGFIFNIPILINLGNRIMSKGLLQEFLFSLEGGLIWILGAFLIQKWLNVKKYQETWARHSDQKLAVDQEMVKFIYEIGGYENQNNKRKLFIERCLEIWKVNQEKFSDNINNKEIPLMNSLEEFNYFKWK